MPGLTVATGVDRLALEAKVKAMYKAVAEEPEGRYHFEMGRGLAERLGYPVGALDEVPAEAVASFAGVGYFFDLAQLATGEDVVDLGSGSGMDAFIAADAVGEDGSVTGVDMTREQLEKATGLRDAAGAGHLRFVEGHIERLPLADASADVVISNGVINLSPEKEQVFAEAYRVLRPGGRLAIADIVTARHLTERITCNADLWAACIGGAAQNDDYQDAIATAGFEVTLMHRNDYRFISESARGATDTFGVFSVSLLAYKPDN
jgi:arsenite methyltransferase